jgi:two-component system, LytTR family, response regulator
MKKPWRTIIVDDEELARSRLKSFLNKYKDDFNLVGEAADGDTAFHMLEDDSVDIVFLDIRMPGKDVFSTLRELKFKPFVVFCTAFDQYALQAFDALAVDYLVKPVEEERFIITLEKLRRIQYPPDSSRLDQVLDAIRKSESRTIPTSIPYKTGDKTILVKLEQVVYFEMEDKVAFFYKFDGQKCITDLSLKTLEERLPVNFIRVSKSTILNKEYVREIHRYFRGRVVFVLDDSRRTKITSGAAYNDAVKRAFDW